MEITATREEIYETVYAHLSDLYKHLYFAFKPVLSLQDKAIISYQSYQEMIQMAQKGYINDYYERIKRSAV